MNFFFLLVFYHVSVVFVYGVGEIIIISNGNCTPQGQLVFQNAALSLALDLNLGAD